MSDETTSRSVQRRIAAQRGEEQPTFDGGETTKCGSCGHDEPHTDESWQNYGDGLFCGHFDGIKPCLCEARERTIAALQAEVDAARAELAEVSRVAAGHYGVLIEEMRYAWNPLPSTFLRFEEIEAFIRSMGAHDVVNSLRRDYETAIDESRIFFIAALREKQTQVDELRQKDARIAELEQFLSDATLVLGRGRIEDQLRLNARMNSYSPDTRGELLITGIMADEAAYIRNKEPK